MALKKAGASAAALPDEMPEVPTSIPRDRYDRPLIVPPGGGRAVAYTRASTLGKAIEDTYNLSRWAQRNVALGLSRRPDLVALAAAVRTNEGEDRASLDEIADKAHEAAKGDRGANVGTALHKLSERRDAGEDLSYLPTELAAALDAYSRCMAPLQVLASETFVVHDELETAGSFDRVVIPRVPLVAPDGTKFGPADDPMILDLKTGKAESARYWGPGYSVQQTVYAFGTPYVPNVGRHDWRDLLDRRRAPSRTWALILHVPSDSPSDAGLVWVNLEIGAALAELCVEVRKARKVKGMFAPCAVPPSLCPTCIGRDPLPDCDCHPSEPVIELSPGAFMEIEPSTAPPGGNVKPVPAQVRKALLIAQLRQAADEAALDALWQANQADWDEDATRMVRARLSELERAAVSA